VRGTERRVIYKDEKCYLHYLDLLSETVERFGIKIQAYTLMPNHAHLVIETPEGNLSGAMQWLNGSYSMWFNRKERRVGSLLQGRFGSVLFEERTEAWAVTRYVHLNPVRVKGLDLDKTASKAEALGLKPVSEEKLRRRLDVLKEFRWSSYQYYAGWRTSPDWLTVKDVLGRGMDGEQEKQRAAYRKYVESTLGQMLVESPFERAASGFLLGSKDWVEKMRRLLLGDRKEQKAFRELEKRPEWGQVRAAVEQVKEDRWRDFCDRHGDWGRDMAFYIARRRCGITLRKLGDEAGVDNYYAVAQSIRRISKRLKKEQHLQKTLQSVINCIKIQT
jgi:putative transposase